MKNSKKKYIDTVVNDPELDSNLVDVVLSHVNYCDARDAIYDIKSVFDIWALYLLRGGYDYAKEFIADEANGDYLHEGLCATLTDLWAKDATLRDYDYIMEFLEMFLGMILPNLGDGLALHNSDVLAAKKAYAILLEDLIALAGADSKAFADTAYEAVNVKDAIDGANYCLDALQRKVAPVLFTLWQLRQPE